ncbi:unnamed protein product [Diabrotica balteata]|uniref:Uncharacterized protein n=1 Tax=Diabrotica balteata TaxID=107213 RepID=A0A9N9XE89_DIABA|nr:unnamed protein product [Diabrotica balteata]
MVLESGVLPPPLQLYAAAAAHLAPRPPWAPLLQFPGAAQLLGMHGAFSPLNRPRYPHGLVPGMRAAPGPPSEDSGSETVGKAQTQELQKPTDEITSNNISTQDVIGHPPLKNVLPAQTVTFQTTTEQNAITETAISALPVLLNISSPQILQESNTLVSSQDLHTQDVLVSAPILTTVNLSPLVTENLTSVPPSCDVSNGLANMSSPYTNSRYLLT